MSNTLTIINGTEVIDCSGFVEGLDTVSEELIFNESDASVTFSTSNELSIAGSKNECYNYLVNHFFGCQDNCRAEDVHMDLFISCCNRTKSFVIKWNMIEWCIDDCTIKFELLSNSSIEQSRMCLDEQLWWVDYIDQRRAFDAIYYHSTTDLSPLDIIYESYRFLDILDFHFQRCGVTLQSTLLNQSPYDNLTFGWNNSYGGAGSDVIIESSLLSVIDLINRTATLLNAKYFFVTDGNGGTTMIFEHEDYFNDENNITVIPYEYFNTENSICVKYSENEKLECASTRYFYTSANNRDYINETRLIYDDSITWLNNDQFNRFSKCETEFLFHVPFFEIDGRFKNLEVFDSDIPVVTIWDGNQKGTPNSGSSFATAIRSAGSQNWNYPLYVDVDSSTGLFQKFHNTDDPNSQQCSIESSDTSLSIQPNGIDLTFCQMLGIIENIGIFFGIKLQNCNYIIRPKQITINYDTKTFDLENIDFVT